MLLIMKRWVMSKSKSKIIKLEDSLAVRERPKVLDAIIGNDRNMETIKGFFKERKLPKTWALLGLTGAGKTTVARIIATTVNCQNLQGYDPCLKCDSCVAAVSDTHSDIYEINGGGDEGLIANVKTTLKKLELAAMFNYRVLIVDEAHLFPPKSKEVILKSMEEPPPGTVWIVCTTEPEKLPSAVLGRCIKLYFNYPSPKSLKLRLNTLAKKEFNKDVVKIIKPYTMKIAEAVNNQPRDAMNLLQQLGAYLNSFDAIGKVKDSEIEGSLTSMITTAGNTDVQAIRTLTFLFSGKKQIPFEIISEIEPSKISDFVNKCFGYSYYAYLFALNRKKKGKGINKRNFYYINYIRWEKALDKLRFGKDIKGSRALVMCNSSTEALQKIRLGGIGLQNCLVWMIGDYLERI